MASLIQAEEQEGEPALPRSQFEGSTEAECEGHGLIDPLHPAGHEVVEEDDGQEEPPVPHAPPLLLLLLPLPTLVVSRHPVLDLHTCSQRWIKIVFVSKFPGEVRGCL